MNDLDNELWIAVAKGNKKLVEELIERGADVYLRDIHGATLLHHALKWRRGEDMIDFLLNKGLDVKAQDNYSNTSLDYFLAHIKYYSNQYKIMWKLIEAGGDMNLPNSHGQTPFELMLLFNNYYNANTDEEKEKRDLEKAIFIDKLIDHGADVKVLKSDGWVHARQQIFFRNYDQDTYLNLLSKGAIFPSEESINYRAEFIDQEFITRTLSDEKKYIGIKALRKAIDNSKTLKFKIKEHALREIDKTLAKLKNPAFHALITKIRAGFDNEKVEDRYKQIARDMSSDYPEVTLLKEYGKGRIGSEEFINKYDSQFLGSVIEKIRTKSPNPILQNTEMVTKVSAYLNLEDLKKLRTALKPETVKKYNPKEINKIFDDLSSWTKISGKSVSLLDRIKKALKVKPKNKERVNSNSPKDRSF